VLKLGHFAKWIRNSWRSFVLQCWTRMEKISWSDRVKNEEVLQRFKEERNSLHAINRRKANWICHIIEGR